MPERSTAAAQAASETGLIVRPLSEAVVTDAVVWGLLEAAPDGLVMVDGTGRILLVNRRFEELFGYDRGELLGQTIEILLPETVRTTHIAHRADFAATPRTRPMGVGLQLVGRRRDGSDVPVEISLSPLESDTGTWVIAAVRDATDRRAAETHRRNVALVDETSRIASDIGDTVIRALFGTGLRLQSLLPRIEAAAQHELVAAIDEIDRTIRELRDAIFGLRTLDRPPHQSSPDISVR